MLRPIFTILLVFLWLSAYTQWNDWKDAESVKKLLLKAQDAGKSYFSQFDEYNVRGKDINMSKYKEQTREIPYIYGLDFYYASGTYFPEQYKRKLKDNIVEVVKTQWRENKAIPLFSWHLENPYVPSDFGEYMGSRYRYGQKDKPYPENHRYVIKEILTGKGGESCGFGTFKATENNKPPYRNPSEWFETQCMEVADIINEFIDDSGKSIPIIVRLWHECEDTWMWWGSQAVSVEDYKKFFIHTQKLIKRYASKSQIIWGYGTDRNWKTKEEFMLRYPGDQYVDIIGYDDYQIGNPNKEKESFEKAEIVASAAKKHGKIAAIFETANLNKQTSDNFLNTYLLPLLKIGGVDFGIIQLWNVGEFDKECQYVDRKDFLNDPKIIVKDCDE